MDITRASLIILMVLAVAAGFAIGITSDIPKDRIETIQNGKG